MTLSAVSPCRVSKGKWRSRPGERRAPQYSEVAAKQPAPPQRTRVYSSSKENNAIAPPRKAEKTKKTGKNLGNPPPGDQPKKGNPPPGDKPKTRKRRRKRRAQLQRSAVEQGCACQCQRTPNLLLGDSLVGGMTGRVFSQLQTPNTVRAISGAKIRRLIEEVASLNLNRNSTLLLSVGGNDVFPKNARHGLTEAIVRDLDHLLETAKSKVNRCVVVGILSRKYRTNEAYSRALGVNRRIAALCNKNSFRFVDPWTAFYGRDVLFQRDGVHFSISARTLAELLNSRIFKPVKELMGAQADKPVPVHRLNNKKPRRNRKRRKQQPEKTTTRSDASVLRLLQGVPAVGQVFRTLPLDQERGSVVHRLVVRQALPKAPDKGEGVSALMVVKGTKDRITL